MKVLKVKFKEVEKVRRFLIDNNLYGFKYLLCKDEQYLFVPILDEAIVHKKYPKLEIIEKDMKPIKTNNKYSEILKDFLSNEEYNILPRSYDVVGTIAILDIPNELLNKSKKIANALLNTNKQVKTILRKADIHKGQYRTQKLEYLAGKETKETIHIENNAKIKLNVETVYFSTRSANERKRIYKLVKPNEDILVMFSGAAPFPLVISKNTQANKIYGIELNPIAHKYATESIKLNKISNIKLFNGDVKEIIPTLNKKFDRILLPLPKTADEFLSMTINISKKGTIIHLYLFLSDSTLPFAKENIRNIFSKENVKYKINDIVKCGSYSPGVFRTCLDIEIL